MEFTVDDAKKEKQPITTQRAYTLNEERIDESTKSCHESDQNEMPFHQSLMMTARCKQKCTPSFRFGERVKEKTQPTCPSIVSRRTCVIRMNVEIMRERKKAHGILSAINSYSDVSFMCRHSIGPRSLNPINVTSSNPQTKSRVSKISPLDHVYL